MGWASLALGLLVYGCVLRWLYRLLGVKRRARAFSDAVSGWRGFRVALHAVRAPGADRHGDAGSSRYSLDDSTGLYDSPAVWDPDTNGDPRAVRGHRLVGRSSVTDSYRDRDCDI